MLLQKPQPNLNQSMRKSFFFPSFLPSIQSLKSTDFVLHNLLLRLLPFSNPRFTFPAIPFSFLMLKRDVRSLSSSHLAQMYSTCGIILILYETCSVGTKCSLGLIMVLFKKVFKLEEMMRCIS